MAYPPLDDDFPVLPAKKKPVTDDDFPLLNVNNKSGGSQMPLLDLNKEVQKARDLKTQANTPDVEAVEGDPFTYGVGAVKDKRVGIFSPQKKAQVEYDATITGLSNLLGHKKEDIEQTLNDAPYINDADRIGKLTQLKKDNPTQYERQIGAINWQFPLHSAIYGQENKETADAIWNSLMQSQTNPHKSYDQAREDYKNTEYLIHTYVHDGDEQQKLISNLQKDASINYAGQIKGTDEALMMDKNAAHLNKNELLGLNAFKDFDPAHANFDNLSIDPKTLDQVPYIDAQGVKSSYTVDTGQRVGYQEQKQKLAQKGIELRLNAASEHLYDYKKKAEQGELTPDEQADLNRWQDEYDNAQSDLQETNNPNSKDYGLAASYNIKNVAQELGEQKHGFFVTEGLKFLDEGGAGINSLVSGAHSLFDSKENNKRQQLSVIGQGTKQESETYVKQANRALQTEEIVMPPELKKQIDDVNNNKDLSDEEKQTQREQLLANNKDWYKKPIDPKFNLTAKSLAYGVGDAINTLGTFLLNDADLGGLGNVSKIKKATTTIAAMMLTDYNKSYESNLRNNISNPAGTAARDSFIKGAAFAVGDNVGMIKNLVKGKGAAVEDLVNKMSDDEILDVAKKAPSTIGNLTKGFAGTLKEAGKGSLQMTTAGAGGQIATDALNNNLQSPEDYFKQNLVGVITNFPLLATMGAVGKTSEIPAMQQHAWYDIASKPDQYIKAVDDKVKSGDLSPDAANKIKQNIEIAAQVHDNLPYVDAKGKELSDENKSRLLVQKIKEQGLKEQSKKDNPPAIQEKLDTELAKTDAENNLIYAPKTEEQLIKRKEQIEKSLEPIPENSERKELSDKEKLQAKGELQAINDKLKEEESKSTPSKPTIVSDVESNKDDIEKRRHQELKPIREEYNQWNNEVRKYEIRQENLTPYNTVKVFDHTSTAKALAEIKEGEILSINQKTPSRNNMGENRNETFYVVKKDGVLVPIEDIDSKNPRQYSSDLPNVISIEKVVSNKESTQQIINEAKNKVKNLSNEIDKINAKYDAELKLKQPTIEGNSALSDEKNVGGVEDKKSSTPIKDEYKNRLSNLDDKVKHTDVSNLKEGDYVNVPQTEKSSGVKGFVKKVGRTNVVLDTFYQLGSSNDEGIMQEITVKKSEIKEFLKPNENKISQEPNIKATEGSGDSNEPKPDKKSSDIQNESNQTVQSNGEEQTVSKKSVLDKDIKDVSIDDIVNEIESLKKSFKGEADISNSVLKSDNPQEIGTYISKAKSVLETLYPKSKLETYDNEKDFESAGGEAGTRGYAIMGKNGEHRILLNLEQIKEDNSGKTAIHEVIHPIVYDAFGVDSQKLIPIWNDIATEMEKVPGMEKVFEHIQWYGRDKVAAEGLTETLTQIAAGNIDISKVPKSTANKIIDVLNKLFETLGMSFRIDSVKDFGELANKIKSSFEDLNVEGLKEIIKGGNIDKFIKDFEKVKGKDVSGDRLNKLHELLRKKIDADLADKKITEDEADKLYEQYGLEKPKKSGIRHEDTAAIREKQGLGEYQRTPETISEWDAEADRIMKENPKYADELLDKLEKGDYNATKVDQRILDKHVNKLDAELTKNTTKEKLSELNRAVHLSDKVAGSEVAKSLVSRKGTGLDENSLGAFLLEKQTAQEAPLSDAQMKEQTDKYNELKKAKDDLEAALKIEQEKNAQLISEIGFNKAKAEAKKASKRTHDDHVKIRKDAVGAAREALRKLRTGEAGLTSRVPLLNELTAIAPHVKTFMKDLIEEGASKLEDVINDAYAEFKDVLDGINKTHIRNILGGEYDVKDQTRNQKVSKLRLFQREAKLLAELERARKGESEAKNETARVEKSRRIDELEKKIKEVRAANKEKELSDEGVTEASTNTKKEKTNVEKNIDRQEHLKKRIEKLTTELKNKTYAPEEKVQDKFPLSKATQALEDKVINLEHKRAVEIKKDEYQKLSKFRKAYDKVMNVLGIKRLVQTAIDASIWGRQLRRITFNVRKADVTAKFIKAGLQSVFSQVKYDRIMNDIHKSHDFKETLEDGIKYNELDAVDPNERNEMFQRSFLYEIPVLREPILASQRIADASLNVARYELYQSYKRNLLKQGITRESDPKTYKRMGELVMNMTGSGKLLKAFEKNASANRILGNTFYGAKLMASNLNMLNPYYYFKTPEGMRLELMKDMLSYTSAAMALGLAGIAAGGKVSLNPNDPDFLQLRFGDKVYDLTGGQAAYIRTGLRVGEAAVDRIKVIAGAETNKEAAKSSEFAAKSAGRFLLNKAAPNTGFVFSELLGGGKNAIGQELSPLDPLKIYPMYGDDMYKAMKEDGLTSFATVLLPNLIGIGYSNYPKKGISNFTEEDEKDPTFKYFLDKGMTLPNVAIGSVEITNEKEGTKKKLSDYPEETQNKYLEEHKKQLKSSLSEIIKDKNVYIKTYKNADGETIHTVSLNKPDNGNYKKELIDNLSEDEYAQVLSLGQKEATTKTKEEMFPTKKARKKY